MNTFLKTPAGLGSAIAALGMLAACATPLASAVPDAASTTASPQRPQRSLHARPASLPPLTDDALEPAGHAGDPDRLTPGNVRSPQITNLDPDLRSALQAAARAATADGVPFWVTSGWRSRAHQQRLLDAAVVRYGSLKEALRWVSTPDGSAHVTGDAVDIGPAEADRWLERNGSRWGLCRVFANEVWHFELATGPGGSCPALIPDSSYRSR